MDGAQLVALGKQDMKDLIGVANGIVMHNALTAIMHGEYCTQDRDESVEIEDSQNIRTSNSTPTVHKKQGLEQEENLGVEAEAHADVEIILGQSPLDSVPAQTTQKSQEEWEEIKRQAQEKRELALLAKRRPTHSLVSWNWEGGIVGVFGRILAPLVANPKSSDSENWDSDEGEQGHSTGVC
jgi:hypothetical protein